MSSWPRPSKLRSRNIPETDVFSSVTDEYVQFSPSHFLRTFPALNAEKVQAMTLALLAKLPDDVYAEIISHAM